MEGSKQVTLRPRRFLLITGTIEALLEAGSLTFLILLGYHGFAAGEMGNMVGIFSVSVLFFLLPFALARFIAILGLRKSKPWAYVLTLILAALILITSFFTLPTWPLLFLLLLVYAASTGWAAFVGLRPSGRK